MTIKLYEFADTIKMEIVIRRLPNHKERNLPQFICCFKGGNVLSSGGDTCLPDVGEGTTVEEAVADYVKNICGKKLRFHYRDVMVTREFQVPDNLVA